MVVWHRAGDQWTVTRLGLGFLVQGFADLNNSGQFTRLGSVYSLTGGTAVGEALPPLSPPPAVVIAYALNDAGIAAGVSLANDGSGTAEALVWFRDQSGTWRTVRLGALYDAAKWLITGSLETLRSPGFGAARARDIDNAGRIVGSVWDDATGSERAALWRLP